MSLSQNTYLGPYFRCRTRTESVAATIETCVNPACSSRGIARKSMPFCSHCGWAIDRAFPAEASKVVPDPWEVNEAIKDALSEITSDDAGFDDDFDYHLWVPNVLRPGSPERPGCDSSCGVEVILDEVDIAAEKRWLSEAYPEWSTLVEMYGGGTCETRWGMLRWCS